MTVENLGEQPVPEEHGGEPAGVPAEAPLPVFPEDEFSPDGDGRPAAPEGSRKPQKRKKWPFILLGIFLFFLCLFGALFVWIKLGEAELRDRNEGNSAHLPVSDPVDMPPEADAYVNGVPYNYDDDRINILLLGIDQKNPGEIQDSHQADALYLASFDTKEETVDILAISRNTMVDVDVYDISGNLVGRQRQQICLSYTYSQDDNKASENTAAAVSRLLYGVPISGYYSLFMDAIPPMIDAVGGVPMTVDEDMTLVDPAMKKGAQVTVTGKNAVAFLQFRSGTSAYRLERHKRFISSLIGRAKSACLEDLSLPGELYEQLASHTVTNVSAASLVYLATEAIGADITLHSIQGTVGQDGEYETFVTDDGALQRLLLDIFYVEQKF